MTNHVGNSLHPKDIQMSQVAATFLDGDEEFENSATSTTELQDDAATQNEKPEDRENYKKRYADLKSHYDPAMAAKNKTIKELETKLAQAGNTAMKPPKTPEELEAFRKEWPDIYDSVVSIALQNASTVKEELQEDILEIRKEKERESLALGRQRVLSKHPNFEATVKSQEFNDWFMSKSAGVQALVNSSDPSDLIEGLDMFALESGKASKKAPKQEAALEASMAVELNSGAEPTTGGKGKIWRESEIDELARKDQHWYDRNEAEIEKAFNEGRVLIGQ